MTIQRLPLVSVVIPAYNVRNYIKEAIESALSQDYRNLEVIVVDDGSTDGTAEYALTFGERVIVRRQANLGPAAARNCGVSIARGELVAFLDADDIWLPGMISAEVQYLNEHPDVGVVHARVYRWHANEDGSYNSPPIEKLLSDTGGIIPQYSGWIYHQLIIETCVTITTATIRRQLWETLGGMDETLRIGEDWDFFIRASQRCQFIKLDRFVTCYRIHKASSTYILQDINYEYLVMQRSLARFGTRGPGGREAAHDVVKDRQFFLCFSHGHLHYRNNGSPFIAAEAFLQAFKYKPGHNRTWAYLVLSLARCLKHSIIRLFRPKGC